MTVNLPLETVYILYCLEKNGYEAYLVGGAVRDLLIESQKDIKDFDFTTDATPQEIQACFTDSYYENDFGTVSVTHHDLIEELSNKYLLPKDNLLTRLVESEKNKASSKNRIIDLKNAKKVHISLQKKAEIAEEQEEEIEKRFPPFEITTYRSDGKYLDHRRPDSVTWGETIKDDLDRRDFSTNAMAIKVNSKLLEDIFSKEELDENYLIDEKNYELIDLHHGLEDLKNKIIRTVGDPDQRFKEDALRMLRAIRFAVQLEMEIEKETYNSILENKDLIRHVSFERIRDEFLKILIAPEAGRGIRLLDKLGLLEYILPELYAGQGMQQKGHHISDVWDHSIDALNNSPSDDPIVRLATLLHDIGKPASYKEKTEEITFYNHDILGSRIASKIAKRLRLSKKDVQRVFTLVRYHMFYYQPEHSDASIRRFIKRVGFENIDDILDLREADRLGSGAKKTSWRLEEMKERVIEQLNQPTDLTDLAIDGNDLIKEFNLKPGPILGKILNQLLELILENPEKNNREDLIKEAKELI